MNELYQLIEAKIKASGYPGDIDGREFYNDISDEVEEKENGTYLFIIKKSDTLEYKESAILCTGCGSGDRWKILFVLFSAELFNSLCCGM